MGARLDPILGISGATGEVFCQPGDGFSATRVVLHAVDAGEDASRGATLHRGSEETGDGIETYGWGGVPVVSESDLEAIREARANDTKVRMLGSEALESFETCGDGGFLPLRGGFARQTGGIGEIARSAARSGGQARV
jgi:hypothetical protein